MQKSSPYRIINLSDMSADWHWLRDEFVHLPNTWTHYSSLTAQLPKRLPKKQSVARFIQAFRSVQDAKKQPSLLVSHGPRPAFYGARIAQHLHPSLPHLVYSFNFTNLPKGYQRKIMAKAFQQVDRFVVFSNMEKRLYVEYFDLDPARIDMLLWSVHKPLNSTHTSPLESDDYICAIGSQGRDYDTLISAMHSLPNIKLVVVATPDSIGHLPLPENVKVYKNIPLAEAQNILLRSRFMVVPLRDSQVPCGHVTIVNGMFFKKAMVVTNSEGVHDYIQDNVNGVFVDPNDANHLAMMIEELWNDTGKTNALAEAGYKFANTKCTEKSVVDYFAQYLNQTGAV